MYFQCVLWLKVRSHGSSELGVVEGRFQWLSMNFFCPAPERGSETARCWYWTWGEIKRYYNGSDTKLVLVPSCASSLRMVVQRHPSQFWFATEWMAPLFGDPRWIFWTETSRPLHPRRVLHAPAAIGSCMDATPLLSWAFAMMFWICLFVETHVEWK